MSEGEFQEFEVEAMLSRFEQTVDYNYSESGVHPARLDEIITEEQLREIYRTELNYPEVNGNRALRSRIAALHDGANEENVLVTVGAAEANYLLVNTLISRGDHIAVMSPYYRQVWGIAKNIGANISTFSLRHDDAWSLDIDELEAAVNKDTKLIAVCNPNNPTGYILSESEMDAIVSVAKKSGAWLLADEVYAGAERESDNRTPSFYGRYDKVVALNSLSKAYGLPGLRTGWAVGPADILDSMWRRHEYTTISSTMLGNKLAEIVLSPPVHAKVIARTRTLIRAGYPILQQFISDHAQVLSVVPPQASAMSFIRYDLDISSLDLVERLRKDKGVLVIPGDHFGVEKHIRLSYALDPDYLQAGFSRIAETIREIQRGK